MCMTTGRVLAFKGSNFLRQFCVKKCYFPSNICHMHMAAASLGANLNGGRLVPLQR